LPVGKLLDAARQDDFGLAAPLEFISAPEIRSPTASLHIKISRRDQLPARREISALGTVNGDPVMPAKLPCLSVN